MGLLWGAVPFGEVAFIASFVYIPMEESRDGGNARVPGTYRLIAVAIVTGQDSQFTGLLAVPDRFRLNGWVMVIAAIWHQLYGYEYNDAADDSPEWSLFQHGHPFSMRGLFAAACYPLDNIGRALPCTGLPEGELNPLPSLSYLHAMTPAVPAPHRYQDQGPSEALCYYMGKEGEIEDVGKGSVYGRAPTVLPRGWWPDKGL